MRSLFLIRHAKSSWDNPTLRDFQRPLNERGLVIAPQMAALLFREKIVPDLLVTSPARRALDTSRFFAVVNGFGDEQLVREEDIYEASPVQLLRVISRLPESANTVFLFGHNPTMTDVANVYAAKPIDNIPTCGIVQIDTTAATWSEMFEGNARVVKTWFPKEVL
jgi:phosphohistidine phosphatase